jgi:hypothetical protein
MTKCFGGLCRVIWDPCTPRVLRLLESRHRRWGPSHVEGCELSIADIWDDGMTDQRRIPFDMCQFWGCAVKRHRPVRAYQWPFLRCRV